MTFRVETKKQIALDSPDHLCPVGCINDNCSSPELIDEVIQYFGGKKITALDLGCAGGQFVVDFINRGHNGIGLEGSSNVLNGSGKHNWQQYLNKNLFLCDLTEEYQLYENDIPLEVDYIHSEEVFEHIHPDKLDIFLQQIRKHLKDDGICSFGISLIPHEVVIDNILYVLHQSVFSAEWWKNKLIENGFEILEGCNNKENYFGYIFNNVVRNDCSDSSCYFVVKKSKKNNNILKVNFDSFLQTKSYNKDFDLLHEGVLLSLKKEKEIQDTGLWLEFGVFKGKTINFISSLNPNQTIFGFDSFYGLPEHWRDGLTTGCFNLDGNLPNVNENVVLIKGWFKDTLQEFLDKQPIEKNISFLHIDSDIYSSAKEILYSCHERITEGTIIIFDEFYNYPEYMEHEYKAWKEYCEDFGVSFRYLGHTNGEEFHHQVMLEILEINGSGKHNWQQYLNKNLFQRTEIINFLIENISAKKYLEIGVSDGTNFSNVKCDYKVGVDPSTETSANFHLTSDEFFERNEETFDVIFVDGLHHADQVYRDVMNSLKVLNEGGYIVCHDLNPVEEQHQIIPYQGGAWNGDCWKAFVMLRMERDDLEMYTVDADCGCGIITRGSQELLNLRYPMTYYYLDRNRKELLNLISPEEFLSKFVDTKQYDLSELLHNYVYDPESAENNFTLGLYYDGIGQTASALSYYLRCAERTDNDLLKYECLIRGAMCFDKQGTRNFTVKSLLLHALALCPHRPEAYYLMSCFYEKENKDGSWNDSYTIASIGLKVSELNPPPLKTTIDYPGEYALHFRKAVASWWCGLCEESKKLHLELLDKYEMTPTFRQNAIDNLKRMNVNIKPFAVYTKDKFDKLKIKFDGSEIIQENYSESYQDMFVLTMLNGKKNGTYLEIGAGNAFYGNNTALLEKEFGWKGVALDIDEGFVAAHTNERSNPCLLKDATKINYVSFLSGLEFSNNIDYLQLDCDPPEVTYKILLSMPFDTHKFAVITYEHDYYCDETKSFQEKSRKYLESYGYIRVVNNISPDENKPYEDWWVHPELVDKNIINKMLNISDETKKAENYILNL